MFVVWTGLILGEMVMSVGVKLSDLQAAERFVIVMDLLGHCTADVLDIANFLGHS